MSMGTDFASATLNERFDCPACSWRGRIVVNTVEMIVLDAPAADPARLERLRAEEARGTLSETERTQLRAQEDVAGLQAQFGSVEAGLNRRASAAAPRAAQSKARWLADSARCPGCNRRHPERVRAWRGHEMGLALNALFFSLVLAFILVVFVSLLGGDGALGLGRFALALGLALPAWAVYVFVSVRNRWNAPTEDVSFVPDAG